jgi:hypothetical protein
LKTNRTGNPAVISRKRRAIATVKDSVSITHGPAINSSGWLWPHW